MFDDSAPHPRLTGTAIRSLHAVTERSHPRGGMPGNGREIPT